MKTIREWAETMNEPYRSKILDCMGSALDYKASSLSCAIFNFKLWTETIDGNDYWHNVHSEILAEINMDKYLKLIESKNATGTMRAIIKEQDIKKDNKFKINYSKTFNIKINQNL